MRLPAFQNPFLRERDAVVAFLSIAILLNWTAFSMARRALARAHLEASAAENMDDAAGDYQLDLRLATEDEIALLPGVGTARAREFCRARALGFQPAYLRDLRAIPGFGESTIARIRPMLRFPANDLPP
jgi:hypothetical protein